MGSEYRKMTSHSQNAGTAMTVTAAALSSATGSQTIYPASITKGSSLMGAHRHRSWGTTTLSPISPNLCGRREGSFMISISILHIPVLIGQRDGNVRLPTKTLPITPPTETDMPSA